jgi:copper chaperone CopZ
MSREEHLLTVADSILHHDPNTTYMEAMTTYAISGMTCAGCARKVEATLKALSPEAVVTLEPPHVSISSITVAQMNVALAQIGKYRVVEAAGRFVMPAYVKTYYPLFLILALIAVTSFASQNWMQHFMAGFFIIFGAFKLLDVPNFADAYSRYDVVAKIFNPWGYAFPFIETALGFAFLFSWQLKLSLWAALILSLVGAVGVVQSVLSKQTIQCACLGTVFKLPMSTITIIENLGMAAMAGWMLAGMAP